MPTTAVGPKAARPIGAILLLCFVSLIAGCGEKKQTGFEGAWKDKSSSERIDISKSEDGFTVRYHDNGADTFAASVSPGNPYLLEVDRQSELSGPLKVMLWLQSDVPLNDGSRADFLLDERGHVWERLRGRR